MNEETEAQSKITHSESGRTTSKPVSSDPKPTFLTTLLSSIYGSGRSFGDRNGHAFQYSCLGNPLDREAWQATVGGVAKSWTWLSYWALPIFSCHYSLDSLYFVCLGSLPNSEFAHYFLPLCLWSLFLLLPGPSEILPIFSVPSSSTFSFMKLGMILPGLKESLLPPPLITFYFCISFLHHSYLYLSYLLFTL